LILRDFFGHILCPFFLFSGDFGDFASFNSFFEAGKNLENFFFSFQLLLSSRKQSERHPGNPPRKPPPASPPWLPPPRLPRFPEILCQLE
jgi:hypothetical protein